MKLKYFFYSLIYLAIIIAFTPTVIAWWYRISFWLFAIFLYWIALFYKDDHKEDSISNKNENIILGIIICVLVIVRIIPFIHWGEAPLGYDTGIYLQRFQEYVTDQQEASRPLGLVVNLLSLAGFSINVILHGFLVVFNILLGLSLYSASRALFGDKMIAISVLLIFAISISQHEAYVWMFYRMMVALTICMITFVLISRTSYLAIITGGVTGALHPATFLVFGMAYLLYTVVIIYQRIRSRESNSLPIYAIITGAGMLFLAVGLNFIEFYFDLPYLTQYKLQIPSAGYYLSNELSGLYLDFTGFRLSILLYAPLALLGLTWILVSLRKWWYKPDKHGIILLLSFLLVSLILIISRVIFSQRYYIILDLLIIMFAGVALAKFIEYFINIRTGKILLILGGIGCMLIIGVHSWTRPPWISPGELQELKYVSEQMEDNAYGMSTDAYYTPWVFGYLTSKAITPGYFIDYWSFEEWKIFWEKGNDQDRVELLSRYGSDPIYVFVGEHGRGHVPMEDFLNYYTVKISDHVWKYN